MVLSKMKTLAFASLYGQQYLLSPMADRSSDGSIIQAVIIFILIRVFRLNSNNCIGSVVHPIIYTASINMYTFVDYIIII